MADKKGDKPKYTEVPKDQIPSTIRQSHFSSDDKNKVTTILGAPTPKDRDKSRD